ncbi:MAG TPA: glycosyltransferase family A protein, partial [Cyclobacteriaceae bacterium]
MEYILANGHDPRVEFHQLEPMRTLKPLANETRKRNHGIDIARGKGFTHFLIADADELYEPEFMNMEKARFKNPSLNGLVHPLKVYIKSPTLFTFDHTLVCGIHKLNKDTTCGNFKDY